MQTNFRFSEKSKQIILNELIDGEVLFELEDKDFEFLELFPLPLKTLISEIQKEKSEKTGANELTKDEVLKKFILFGIEEPFEYMGFESENSQLKIGQKKLLKKYSNFFNVDTININSTGTEILFYLKNIVKLSKDSLKKLIGITGTYFFKMDDKIIDNLDIKAEDKNKLKKLLKDINNNKIDKNEEEIAKE